MGKFCGYIAFSQDVDQGHGVWKHEIVKRKYFGDVIHSSKRYENNNGVNDNVILSDRISIVANSFLMTNIPSILYIEYNNTRWKVSSISTEYPRVILTTGGVYNGETV